MPSGVACRMSPNSRFCLPYLPTLPLIYRYTYTVRSRSAPKIQFSHGVSLSRGVQKEENESPRQFSPIACRLSLLVRTGTTHPPAVSPMASPAESMGVVGSADDSTLKDKTSGAVDGEGASPTTADGGTSAPPSGSAPAAAAPAAAAAGEPAPGEDLTKVRNIRID